MSFVENVPGRGDGGGAKAPAKAARSVVAAKDSEACGVAAGGGREGTLAVALGSQQGPEQECTLGLAMGGVGEGGGF